MATTPLITLTATLQNVQGQPIGSVANPSKLRVDLCNFGQAVPVIQGTAILAQIEKTFLSNPSTDPSLVGTFSFTLWANDQISPSGTYYAVTAIDHLNRPVQSGLYLFDAGGVATSIDLSDAPQIVGPVGQLVYEIPTGIIPGSVFTLQYIPFNNQLIALYYNGIFERPGAPPLDYLLSGNTITLNFQATQANSLQAVYVTSGLASIGLPISEKASGVFPGSVFTISRPALNNQLIGLWYNGIFQRPGLDYTLTGTTITLTFTASFGGNVYVAYIPAP